jgi:hypothetical protein
MKYILKQLGMRIIELKAVSFVREKRSITSLERQRLGGQEKPRKQ